ncbi:Cation/H+ exchanger [Suillus subalutaceus]|uniref:Cation/H+ exchanger n=1 Tax=Suillus subalutaceus TaxID=48586 RepID=UPI001B881FD6|nr:Cation/H+ exchanger [Suillus subalutaceus]KAG1862573.1 Cation/H+ exchanger [Suillus subalutaceus]
MALDLLQVSPPGPSYICLGGFTVLFSLVSLLIKEKLYVNEVVLGTVFGIIIGPFVTNIFAPRSWGSLNNTITLEVMRIVLVIGLFAAGVELPCAYMKKHAKSLLAMVVPTMAFGWVVVAAVIHALFPKLDYISALCIAACLTPTDPVTCAAITHGNFAKKHVPEDIRHILLAEAAANDGLAYPFLSISIYLTMETSVRTAIGKWFLVGWLYQVILGTVLGAVVGFIFSKLMNVSHKQGFINHGSYIAQYLALPIFTMGIASTIGADDLLAAFAAGCAISWDGHFHKQTEDDAFSSVIDYVLNCCCFIYIGAWLPFYAYDSPEYGITPWKLVLLVIATMVLRRIPFLLAVYKLVPEIKCWQEALFSGHFGPMGVSAVFVSALALTRLPTPENPPADQAQYLAATIQPIVSFVVLGSIIIHGLSIPFFNVGRIARSRTTSLSKTSSDHTHVADPIC